MTPAQEGGVVLWPRYFETRLSRSEGRRVPEAIAVEEPDVEAIAEAAETLGYEARVDAEARHPRRPWAASGRVVVAGADDKEALLREVAEALDAGNE